MKGVLRFANVKATVRLQVWFWKGAFRMHKLERQNEEEGKDKPPSPRMNQSKHEAIERLSTIANTKS